MPPFAHTTLTVAIIASAAGALVMCLLVIKYGFSSPGDEQPDVSTRRLFVTRLGHAAAAGCFAVTAILAAVTLAQLNRVSPPVAVPRTAGGATDSGLALLTSRLSAAESQLRSANERVLAAEARIRSLSEARRQAPPRRQAAVAPPRPAPPAPRPSVIASAPGPLAPPAAMATPSPPPPSVERPAPSDTPVTTAPPTSGAAGGALRPPTIIPAEPAPKPERPVPSAAVSQAPAQPDNLRSKVKRDWDAVKRGFSTAGRDFNAAIDELSRNVRGAGAD